MTWINTGHLQAFCFDTRKKESNAVCRDCTLGLSLLNEAYGVLNQPCGFNLQNHHFHMQGLGKSLYS